MDTKTSSSGCSIGPSLCNYEPPKTTPDDWRSSCRSLVEKLQKAREENVFTDIQFIIGKGVSSVVFHAHKMILACGSPVFEKMFYGGMAEQRNRIDIEDDDPEAFRMLLDFFYGNVIELESFISAWKFYTIGDKYLVPGIQSEVEKYVRSTCMDEKSFWEVIRNDIFSSPILKQKVDSYIEVNADKLLKSKEFMNVPEALVEHILLMDKLNTSEYELLKFLARWGQVNFGKKTMAKQRLSLFQHVRFSTLSSKEFCSFNDSFPKVIGADNSLEIMKHLYDKSTYRLPSWCSTSNVLRNLSFQQHSSNLKSVSASAHAPSQLSLSHLTAVPLITARMSRSPPYARPSFMSFNN